MNLPLVLVNTTDLLELVTGAAADVDVLVGYLEATTSSGVIVKETMKPGRQRSAITTATTTTILAAPATDRVRGVKGIHIRNKDTVDSTDVTVQYDDNGTHCELHKVTLAPGEALEYIPGVGWFHLRAPTGSFLEADMASDLALTTAYQTAVSLSLGPGTWLVLGMTSIESTSTTQGNMSVRLRDATNSITYALSEGETDSALPDRMSHVVFAIITLTAMATIALQGLNTAGTAHMIGPGNLGSDTASKVTRLMAYRIG